MNESAHILLVAPTHYEVRYAINPWMEPERWLRDAAGFGAQARRSFDALAAALRAAGCRLTVIDGAPGLPDMVFPANAGVVLDGRLLLARFRHPERQGEEAPFARAFAALREAGVLREVATLPAGVFQEGAGDCLWDATRGLFWVGWGQRSNRASGFASQARASSWEWTRSAASRPAGRPKDPLVTAWSLVAREPDSPTS